jgi:hypothetical protein
MAHTSIYPTVVARRRGFAGIQDLEEAEAERAANAEDVRV